MPKHGGKSEVTPHPSFYVATWKVEPTVNRLIRGDETVQVEPKVMQVLVCLAEHAGEVVSRERFMNTVWAHTVVGDDLLTRCISELRKIFGDDPQHPEVIETIRTRGYRLIAPVSWADPEELPSSSVATPPPERLISEQVQLPATNLALLLVLLVGGFAGYQWLQTPSTPPMSVTPLTTFPGEERSPAFSPDGQQVAFLWDEGDHENYDLYVKLVGTEQPLQLTDTPSDERSPAWSPDGRTIAFFRVDESGCGLYTIPAIGGAEQRLTECRDHTAHDLAWSPDGRWLALAERTSAAAPFRIVLLSPQTLERRTLTQPPRHYLGDRSPAFSPDGKTLAFMRSVNGWVSHLFRIPVAGGDAEQLTSDHRDIVGLDWSADGQQLVFASNLGGDYSLWQISAAGGAPERMNTAGLKLKHPALSREGARLAYESWTYTINIWQRSIADPVAPPTRLIASTLWDVHPSISPDGNHVAFASTRSGHFEIWMSEDDGTDPVQITSFEGPFVGMPRWSPDGRHLVFDARPEGPADLYVVDVEERRSRRLTTSPYNDLVPSWSHDGRWIYFTSDRGGSWQVWKIPAAGGDAVQVTTHGGYAAFESGNGTSLYYTKRGESGIWRTSLEGGSETLVLDELAPYDWNNWALLDGSLYFIDRTDTERPTLARLNLDTGRVQSLVSLDDLSSSSGIALSPDGQRLLYTQANRRDSDIMLVNRFR